VVDAFVYLGCILTPPVAAEGRAASDWHSSILHEYVGEENLEVKYQAGNQVTPLSDIHCASMGARHEPPQSTCSLALRIPYTSHVSNAEVSQRNHWLFTAVAW